jgi:hypothetical protein
MEGRHTFPLLDSTNTSSAGNVSTSGFIFSKERGNINYIVKLEGGKFTATGLINPRDIQSLKEGKGLIELTEENMMTGPEYHLYYKQQPAGREVGYQEIVDQQKQKSIDYINKLPLKSTSPKDDSLVAYVTRVNMRRNANGENNLIDKPETVNDVQVLRTALLQEHGLLSKDAAPAADPVAEQSERNRIAFMSHDQLISEAQSKGINVSTGVSDPQIRQMLWDKLGKFKGGRRRKTKKSKRRARSTRSARKTRRRHK